jgi:acyl-CoA reductase-like NAD-dependent aldehyde dehydrogenase/nicotinamidase-related amidase
VKPLLLLVDLQEDFLAEPGLEPHRGTIVAGAARLLGGARARGVAIAHIRTTIRRDPDERMRHWKLAERWSCLEGTPGHAAPRPVAEAPAEAVIAKTGFSAKGEAFAAMLRDGGYDIAVVAGVHTHACVRQAVLDLYEAGLEVWVAREAVGSHEPSHAAQTELYLRRRKIPFVSTEEILALFDGTSAEGIGDARGSGEQIGAVVRGAVAPTGSLADRAAILEQAAALVDAQTEHLAQEIVAEIGKPIRFARGEVGRTSALFRAVAARARGQHLDRQHAEALVRRRPLGRIALITPWNNPLAIAAGQLAPAFVYGNSILWKPAPAGFRTAAALHRLMLQVGVPADALQLLPGAAETGLDLIGDSGVDAVCFTGATATGRLVAALCAERHLPLQAELGGNNGVIVTAETDLALAARQIAEAAFGCAGQRCTATRRAIVLAEIYDDFVAMLEEATAALGWGDPRDETVSVGPLVHGGHAQRVAACVERARAVGHEVIQPHLRSGVSPGVEQFYPPTLVLCDDPEAEIVQEETFGPVLVVQRAANWEEALLLLNGVRQGLAAALYSDDEDQQRDFLGAARAGILKLNQPTVEAGIDVPFGGWKVSGLGPPQHGDANLEFFTRAQAVYVAPARS